MSHAKIDSERSRIIIERVEPEIDGGEFPIKRTLGEPIAVTANVFADGHDPLKAYLRYRPIGPGEWREVRMADRGNDVWGAEFALTSESDHEYTIQACIDRFGSWRHGLIKKREANVGIASELLEGGAIIERTAARAPEPDATELRRFAAILLNPDLSSSSDEPRYEAAISDRLQDLMDRRDDRWNGWTYSKTLRVTAERERSRFGSWYELFPRSCSPIPGRHGTLRDLEATLPKIAAMGFDIVYLPPIHPIGSAFRKGPNNSLIAGPNDPGCPWAIGNSEGGHDAIAPELGSFDDFARLIASASALRLEIALDLAFQCSPDHPWVKEHPDWFRQRPDGTIKYAENPPKKYEDIYPLDFECEDWTGLWRALLDTTLFWVKRGVKVFRVDNPHTKPFRFWRWLIAEVRRDYPEAIFLSEAFTRPKLKKHLAKSGFTQSYTYFTWRNTKAEITEYLRELTQTECRDYLRTNFFANTPDILHEFLQHGGPNAFRIRLILAATLAASYGIYGPVYERCVGTPVRSGSEEYLDSEKYEVRDWTQPPEHDITPLIARINQIRRDHPALQFDSGLQFHETDNDAILAYSKRSPDGASSILTIVNLDPHHQQWGHVSLPSSRFDVPFWESYQVHDLLTESCYDWRDGRNFVALEPHQTAHVFEVRKRGPG